MYIDFKESSWYRVEIKEEHEAAVKEMLEDNKIDYPTDIIDMGFDSWSNTVDETSEQLEILDNDGCSTIEAFKENGTDIFWSNEDNNVKSRSELMKLIADLEGTIDKTVELLTKEDNDSNDDQEALENSLNEQSSRQARTNWR